MFKSVEHRVLASREGPRVSVALFCYPSFHEQKLYGPIKAVLSAENPPKYREFLVQDYLDYYTSKELPGKSHLDHFWEEDLLGESIAAFGKATWWQSK